MQISRQGKTQSTGEKKSKREGEEMLNNRNEERDTHAKARKKILCGFFYLQ